MILILANFNDSEILDCNRNSAALEDLFCNKEMKIALCMFFHA